MCRLSSFFDFSFYLSTLLTTFCVIDRNYASGADLIISTAQGLIDFSNAVNKGTSYSGSTVFLTSDVNLSGKALPIIGDDQSTFFQGTFDGQGHTISNLKISSSGQYIGLFGYSKGMSVKNLVIDSSCSLSGSYKSSAYSTFVSGVIGWCVSSSKSCTIENSINLASVSFSGDVTGHALYLSGIVGYLQSNSYNSVVRNCVNYGSLRHSGKATNSWVGGIVGVCKESKMYNYIQNCLNYGKITYTGTSDEYSIGGIVGRSHYIYIDNCLNGGEIDSTTGSATTRNSGGIVGYIISGVCINYCHYTIIADVTKLYGDGTSQNETGSSSLPVEVDSALESSLNARSSSEDGWNKWILNPNNVSVAFKINGNKYISLSSQVILLPDLSNNRNFIFDGWYNDSECTEKFQSTSVTTASTLYALYEVLTIVTFDVNGGDNVSFTTKSVIFDSTYGTLPTASRVGYSFDGWFDATEEGTRVEVTTNVAVKTSQTLYAHWIVNEYNLTFNYNNGTISEMATIEYNTTISYPEIVMRTGYTFDKWSPNPKRMPEYNLTIEAQWIPNTYNVIFDAKGGNPSQSSKSVTFDSEYGELPSTDMAGYTFKGWFTEEEGKGERITEEIIVKISRDHTLYAHWETRNYTVTFAFENGEENDERSLKHNETIIYPENPERRGYSFNGWSDNITTMPARDFTITALWTPNKYSVSFCLNGGDSIDKENEIMDYGSPYGDLPSPNKVGYTFAGWFTEEEGEAVKRVTEETLVNVTRDHTIYAHWTANNYTITFDGAGGVPSQASKGVTYDNEYGDLPSVGERTGYTFVGWFTEEEGRGERITNNMNMSTPNNQTLHAHWTLNNYIISFVFNNGAENVVRFFNFNESIVYPENLVKEGYTFNGWEPNPERTPANNLTIVAQWVKVEKPSKSDSESVSTVDKSTQFVEIVFGKKDLSKEEVSDILRKYTKDGFTIEKFETDDEAGEIRVIIKFVDKTKAAEFVENVTENKKPEDYIRDAGFMSGNASFSFGISPLLFIQYTFLLF